MSTDTQMIHELFSKLDESPIVMIGLAGEDAHCAPMSVHFDRALPNKLFIYTRKDNRLVEGIRPHGTPAVLQFVSKGHDFFASIHAELSCVHDTILVDRFWSKAVDAWFDGGQSDPALQMVQADLKDAELWGTDLGLVTIAKMALGMDVPRSEFEGSHAEVRL